MRKNTLGVSLAVLTMTAGMAAAFLPTQSFAEEAAKRPQAAANPSAALKKLDKVSQEGFLAMRGIRVARLAIFNGTPDEAKSILTKVKSDLDKAKADASKLPDQAKGTVPIDMQIAIGDDYVATPEKDAHIKKANEHLKNGETQKAIDELKLADIEVTLTEVDLNIPDADKDVGNAIVMMGDGKYYEANMMLKRAEERVSVNSVTIVEPAAK